MLQLGTNVLSTLQSLNVYNFQV